MALRNAVTPTKAPVRLREATRDRQYRFRIARRARAEARTEAAARSRTPAVVAEAVHPMVVVVAAVVVHTAAEAVEVIADRMEVR